MKKNLRIVSAAAAALLAVAPVAASAVSVNAAVPDASNVAGTVPTSAVKASALKSTAEKDAQSQYMSLPLGANGGNLGSLAKNLTRTNVTAKAGEPTLTTTGNNTSAKVPVTVSSTVTFTVETSKIPAEGNLTFALGPSWGTNAADVTWSTDSNGVMKLTKGKEENGETTFSFTLTRKYNVSYNKVDTTVAKPSNSSSSSLTGSNNSSLFYGDVNTAVNINAIAQTDDFPGAFNGNITATVDGKNLTAVIETSNKNGQNTTIYTKKGNVETAPSDLKAGVEYVAQIKNVRFYLGADKQGKNVSFVLPDGSVFASNNSRTKSVTVGADGYADLGQINSDFYAYDATNVRGINFFSKTTGEVVKSGSVDLHAVNGQLNVESVYATINRKYGALQAFDKQSVPTVLLPLNDIKDQLEKQNIKVDANGYFKAPASFNLTMTAKSRANGAEATLPVTVNVDNVTPAASQETTRTVKIMHIATIYDKNGKATHEPALRAYNTVSVVSDPVSLKDEKGNDAGKFYKLAGKDQYIKVGNVDGTSRSLKHNSYVYKSTGKRRGKTVLKKGSSVTTYGKSFMIAGHQMYRIGENKYVKKANF